MGENLTKRLRRDCRTYTHLSDFLNTNTPNVVYEGIIILRNNIRIYSAIRLQVEASLTTFSALMD